MTFSVQSGEGQLRQAIVHRPGVELSRLAPQDLGEPLDESSARMQRAATLNGPRAHHSLQPRRSPAAGGPVTS